MRTPGCWQELARFIVYSLAVARVTYMLWQEDGPWDVIDWVRAKVGVHYKQYPNGQQIRTADTFLGKLLNCPMCLSLWLSAAAVGLFLLHSHIVDIGVSVLSMAGLVMLMMVGVIGDD